VFTIKYQIIIWYIKHAGGLGVGSLRDKNKALLFKWLWRLWKDVIKSIHNTNYSKLLLQAPIRAGTIWTRNVNHCVKDNRLQDIVNERSLVIIGNGKKTMFWLDF